MAVRTGRDFITRALRIINAINVGEDPEAEEANDAIALFNDMLGMWATQRLTIPFTSSEAFLTIAGKKVYSLGPGGDWEGNRPIRIRDAIMRLANSGTSNLDIPLTILSNHQYSDVPLKDISSTQSRAIYYENQYPLGQVTLYPVPSAIFQVVLTYDGFFTQVLLDTDLSTLPQGYALAIQYNLAKLLAVEYNRDWSAAKDEIARSSLASLKSANMQSVDAEFDAALPGVGTGRAWDWRLG